MQLIYRSKGKKLKLIIIEPNPYPEYPKQVAQAVSIIMCFSTDGMIFTLWIISDVYFAFMLIVPSGPPTEEIQTNASSGKENAY